MSDYVAGMRISPEVVLGAGVKAWPVVEAPESGNFQMPPDALKAFIELEQENQRLQMLIEKHNEIFGGTMYEIAQNKEE